jgi:hypothetical protein
MTVQKQPDDAPSAKEPTAKTPTAKAPTNKYARTLDELEASARVKLEDQTAEQPEPPSEPPLTQTEVDRQAFLRVAGAP